MNFSSEQLLHYYPQGELADWFPHLFRENNEFWLKENPTPAHLPQFSERHLHCIWADERLRPKELITSNNEPVWVEHPGEWNSGAGPDFLNAVLRVGEGRRRISGDVEIHVHPADWKRHHHEKDPRYQRLCAHVTWNVAGLPSSVLPAGTLQMALSPLLTHDPLFLFENIDVMAYPSAARAPIPPCQKMIHSLPRSQWPDILDTAGEVRFLRRTQYLQSQIQQQGMEQTLYQEILASLGYRPNRAILRQLAMSIPLAKLREFSEENILIAYAILLGHSGLLVDPSAPTRKAYDTESRRFIRQLWDYYWRIKNQLPNPMPKCFQWTLTGIRPANRPERRLMAAAALFAPQNGLPECLNIAISSTENPILSFQKTLDRFLEKSEMKYWSHHLSYVGKPLSKPIALIGPSRIHAILLNVWFPMLTALRAAGSFHRKWLDAIPAEETNQVIRQMAQRLFGNDHSPSLYRTGLRRQGLIHLHHYYCLADHSSCEECSLPRHLGERVP